MNRGDILGEVCLICEKNKKGSRLKEGFIIKTIRKIKNKLGISKGNTLVICDSCTNEYIKRRQGFEKTILIWSIIGGILSLLLIIPSILVGNIFDILRSILLSIVLVGVLLLLVGLIRYIPKLEKDQKVKKPSITAKNTKTKKNIKKR